MKRIFNTILGLVVALGALQAQNAVTVSDVVLQEGESAIVSVELVNATEFSAFQMDITLPEGFKVGTVIDEDGEEVLDIELSDERKKSNHSLSYNDFGDGTLCVASFSSKNSSFRGQSGEILHFRIEPTPSVKNGRHVATLSRVIFTTPDAVDYRLADVKFAITYSDSSVGEEVDPEHRVELHVGDLGRCVWDGVLIGPYGSHSKVYDASQTDSLHFYFIPFDGYQASSMKRNGEHVEIRNNVYGESLVEDVVFTDVCYETIVDTLVVTETVTEIIVDTLVVTETVVDTLVLTETVTETIVDTLVVTETIVDTLVVTETIVDTLVVTETIVDTLVVTETIVDTLVVTETIVDTLVVEKVDTVFVTEVAQLPTPVITSEGGVVTITCDDPDALIFYAINGSPLEGGLYTAPFAMPSNGVVSAVAIRCSEVATQYVVADGVGHSAMRIVSCRYYTEGGVEVELPLQGVTIVVAQYEDGSVHTYKMVKQ